MLCFERRGRKLIAYLEGELDHDSAALMRAEIDNQLYDRSINELVIDMAGISFMDSSGIGMLIGRYKTMCAKGGRMAACCLSETVSRLYRMAGLHRIIPIIQEEGRKDA